MITWSPDEALSLGLHPRCHGFRALASGSPRKDEACAKVPRNRDTRYPRRATRSGNAAASAARVAGITPRSVISPVTSAAGVTSKA